MGLRDRGYSLPSLPRPRICWNIGCYLCSVRLFQCMNLFTAMNIVSHESVKVLQEKTGHVSMMTEQNRIRLVLLLRTGTDTHFGFISIFFSTFTICCSVSFIILCGALWRRNRFQSLKLHHVSYSHISENKFPKDYFFLLNNLGFISNLAIGIDAW